MVFERKTKILVQTKNNVLVFIYYAQASNCFIYDKKIIEFRRDCEQTSVINSDSIYVKIYFTYLSHCFNYLYADARN